MTSEERSSSNSSLTSEKYNYLQQWLNTSTVVPLEEDSGIAQIDTSLEETDHRHYDTWNAGQRTIRNGADVTARNSIYQPSDMLPICGSASSITELFTQKKNHLQSTKRKDKQKEPKAMQFIARPDKKGGRKRSQSHSPSSRHNLQILHINGGKIQTKLNKRIAESKDDLHLLKCLPMHWCSSKTTKDSRTKSIASSEGCMLDVKASERSDAQPYGTQSNQRPLFVLDLDTFTDKYIHNYPKNPHGCSSIQASQERAWTNPTSLPTNDVKTIAQSSQSILIVPRQSHQLTSRCVSPSASSALPTDRMFKFYHVDSSQSDGRLNMADVQSVVSALSRVSRTYNQYGTYDHLRSRNATRYNPMGKCVLKFGHKSPSPQVKKPGMFSCPRRVGHFQDGSIVVLDSDNQTLQVFKATGECSCLFQILPQVCDMLVWKNRTILLLHSQDIVLFDTTSEETEVIHLQGANGSRCIDQMADPQELVTGRLFAVATLSDLILYHRNGLIKQALHIPPPPDSQLPRINAITVDRTTNHLYALEGQAKVIYGFSCTGHLLLQLSCRSNDLFVTNPMAMCVDRQGQILIADTFQHRILLLSPGQALQVLSHYSNSFFPYDLDISPLGQLIVAVNTEKSSFAGIRVYEFHSARRDKV